MLKAGQVALMLTDGTLASLAVAAAFCTQWTHVCLGLGDGMVLNTAPGTNAVILPEEEVLRGRSYHVLDLVDMPDDWRLQVARAARGSVGVRYWAFACGRLTAEAFVVASVPLFHPSWAHSMRARLGFVLPADFLTHSRLTRVATITN